jgi:Protein tyrosine and serine/threonine kinase
MTPVYEPTQTTYSATPDETLIAEAIEALPRGGERHHTIVHLEHQTVCLSVARAPARDECWLWFSAAAAERAELASERLLPLVSAGNFDGWFYVAHDIGAAVPLSEYRRVAELSTARTLALLLGISHGLDDAVSQGKPPCEVTPDSVFLDPRLGAMIGDLGIAREALGNPAAETDAHAPWVAPEVLRGEDAHPRSAVYSFGAIAYTLLTGGPPHHGTPQEIAVAKPPRISEARPDLPVTLDTVFAVAMATDPRKRYATAAEARHLLNLVIYGAPNAPAIEASPRFRRGSTSRKEPPARRPPTALAAPSEHPRRRTALVGALLTSALLAGGVAGTVAAGGEEAPPAPRATATAAGMGVELPDGWRQQPAPAQRLEAHPVASPNSGLTVVAGAELPGAAERGSPVSLGDYEAWRTDVVRGNDGTRTVHYSIPTRSGAVSVECAATPGAAAPDLLAMCERTASTLSLGSEQTVPLTTIVRAEQRWRLAARRLERDRTIGRGALARAQLQAGQLAASQQLARSYYASAARFTALPGGEAVARAARQAADAYRAMAAAARGDSRSGWAAAAADARSAEQRLAKAIAAG